MRRTLERKSVSQATDLTCMFQSASIPCKLWGLKVILYLVKKFQRVHHAAEEGSSKVCKVASKAFHRT